MIDIATLTNKLIADKKKLLLAVLIVLVFLYVDFAYILKAQMQGFSATNKKVAKVSKDLDALNKDIKNMQIVKIKLADGEKKAVSKEKTILSENQITSLLQDIEGIEQKSGMEIVQMKHGTVTAGSAKKKGQVAAEPALGQLIPYDISLDINGDYHHLGAFINEIENAQVFVLVQGIKISPSVNDVTKQKISLTLKTYVKK